MAEYVESLGVCRAHRVGRTTFYNPCPICGHNDDFNCTDNVWYCQGASGKIGGTIIDFLMYRKGHEMTEAEAIEHFKFDIMQYDKDEWKHAYYEVKEEERQIAKAERMEEELKTASQNGKQTTPPDPGQKLYLKDMKPGISDQVSLGINHDMADGVQLSLEGYYKWLDNVVDYREGISFLAVQDWIDAIAQGKGKAYGVEFLAQKTTGKTRGHVSYTWSKSLRTFDRPGMEINGGKEFYAAGDHRHNFNISVTQRLSKNWDFSASWTFQSGRRTNIAGTIVSHATLDEFNAYRPNWIDSDRYKGVDYTQNPDYTYYSDVYYEGTHIEDLVRMESFRQRNSYQLPAVHRLDLSLSHHGNIGIGEMICDIGIYNVYNQQNISSVYWGYKQNRLSLRGVCLFPIMPSISLTLKL